MSLERDEITGLYGARFKHRIFGRIHIRLKTKDKTVAMRRHSALGMLLDTGEPVADLVDRLRRQQLTIQSVEECVRSKSPFDTLRASAWPTLGIAVEDYMAAIARREGSESTHRAATAGFSHALTFFGTARLIQTISPEEVTAYKAYLVGRTLKNNTLNAYLHRFASLYTFLNTREARRALHQRRAPVSLFSPVDRDEVIPPLVKTRVRFLEREEMALVLAACPASRKAALALGFLAGLRAGEIRMLRRRIDVDLGSGVLHIQERPKSGEVGAWWPKYRKNRDVPISAALRPYLETALELTPESPYLFPHTDRSKPITEKALASDAERVITTAGLVWGRDEAEGITLHTLRHTFASWLVMAGADLFTISKLMGHSGIQQVEQTYSHLSPAHKRKTVELLQFGAAGTNPTPSDDRLYA